MDDATIPSPDTDFVVIGVATRTRNADEFDPATARIPDLWARAVAHPWLSARRDAGFVAVLHDYERDASGSYTQIVGVASRSAEDLPDGLVAAKVASMPRTSVAADGESPGALIGAWQQIWDDEASGAIVRSYRTDFEVHSAGRVEVFVSVMAP